MVMNMPAEVVLAKLQAVLRSTPNNRIERVQAEIPRLAQLTAQSGIFHAATQSPDSVDERQHGELEPGRAQVPNFVLMRAEQQIQRAVPNQQSVIGQGRKIVALQCLDRRFQPALAK